jgi:hypothetical protein
MKAASLAVIIVFVFIIGGIAVLSIMTSSIIAQNRYQAQIIASELAKINNRTGYYQTTSEFAFEIPRKYAGYPQKIVVIVEPLEGLTDVNYTINNLQPLPTNDIKINRNSTVKNEWFMKPNKSYVSNKNVDKVEPQKEFMFTFDTSGDCYNPLLINMKAVLTLSYNNTENKTIHVHSYRVGTLGRCTGSDVSEPYIEEITLPTTPLPA